MRLVPPLRLALNPLRRLAPGLAALLLALAGCGGTDAVPGCERVALALAPEAAEPRDETVVQRFRLAVDLPHWTVRAPSVEPVQVGDTALVALGSGSRERPVSLSRTGHFDPSRFDVLRVVMTYEGRGGLAADLLRDGEVVGTTGAVPVPERGELSPVELPLPPELRGEAPADTLLLRCLGARRRLVVSEVQLLALPPERVVPDPADGAALVMIGHDARRGVGVVSGRPVGADLQVPAGGELRLEWGRPSSLVRPGEAGALTVTLADGATPVDERRLVWSGDDGPLPWAPLVFALEGGPDRRLRLTLSVDGGPRAAAVVAEPRVVVPDSHPPTVLLVTSDTHRGDHLAAMPVHVDVRTPVLDGLARRGTLFDDCFAPTNNTNPSHVALMTGTTPRDTGVLDNTTPLSDAAPTLAERFAAAGWTTVAAVSTRHLGDEGSGLGQGFDRMAWPVEGGRRDSPAAEDDVLGWLPELEGQPLFIWLHVFDAHTPYAPPEDILEGYWAPSRPRLRAPGDPPPVPEQALPRDLKDVADLDYPKALYRGEVTFLDGQLASLLGHPRLADAVIAMTADHGEGMGEHGIWFQHLGVYPATLHIPLVLAGPGVPAGQVLDRPVCHTDLGRTLLDLAGLADQTFPGRDLLAGEPVPVPRFAVEAYGMSASVTWQGLHLVLHLTDRDLPYQLETHVKHEVELFDLATDPDCATNLVDQRPEDARRLRARLVAWLQDQPAQGWARTGREDPELLQALAQLGYVEPAGLGSGPLWQDDDCAWCRRFAL